MGVVGEEVISVRPVGRVSDQAEAGSDDGPCDADFTTPVPVWVAVVVCVGVLLRPPFPQGTCGDLVGGVTVSFTDAGGGVPECEFIGLGKPAVL